MTTEAAASSEAAGSTSGEAANQPWYPDTVKDYVTNKGWKESADVITSYQNLEKLIGEDKAGRTVILPKDEKDTEGIKTFRAKLGVPEAPDKYELPAPPGEGGANLIKEASAWFHEAGIPKSAAQAITSKWNAHIEGLIRAQETQAQTESHAQLEKLKGEWGQEFDAKAEYARRFLKAAGWDDAKMATYERTFGTATMLKDFYQWGSKVGEPGFSAADSASSSFNITKEAVQRQFKELQDARIANRITEKEFHAKMAVLGPQMEAAR